MHRLTSCTTHEEVINVCRLHHEMCWSDEDDSTTDPVFWTAHGNERHKKIVLGPIRSQVQLLPSGL